MQLDTFCVQGMADPKTAPPAPVVPYQAPESPWRTYAPIGAGIAGGSFLVAGAGYCHWSLHRRSLWLTAAHTCAVACSPGTIVGFKRGMQRASKPQQGRAMPGPAAPAPRSNSAAFRVAVKALVYGTGLCVAGATVTCIGVGMQLGVSDVSAALFLGCCSAKVDGAIHCGGPDGLGVSAVARIF